MASIPITPDYYVNDYNGSRLREIKLRPRILSGKFPAYIAKGREVVEFTDILSLESDTRLVEAGQKHNTAYFNSGTEVLKLYNRKFSPKSVFFGFERIASPDEGKIVEWAIRLKNWRDPLGALSLDNLGSGLQNFEVQADPNFTTRWGMNLVSPAPPAYGGGTFFGLPGRSKMILDAWIADGQPSDPLPGGDIANFPFNFFGSERDFQRGAYFNDDDQAPGFTLDFDGASKADNSFVTWSNNGNGQLKRGTFSVQKGNATLRWYPNNTWKIMYFLWHTTEKIYDQSNGEFTIPPYLMFYVNYPVWDPPIQYPHMNVFTNIVASDTISIKESDVMKANLPGVLTFVSGWEDDTFNTEIITRPGEVFYVKSSDTATPYVKVKSSDSLPLTVV